MGFFDNIRADTAIGAIVASPRGAKTAKAVERLRAIGKAAVPKLIAALPRDPSGTLGTLLAGLVSNATLPTIVTEGLLSEDAQVTAAVKRVLLAAEQLDPNRLMEVYVAHGGAVPDIADILLARKEAISAKTILRLLQIAHEDHQPTLFKFVGEIANEAMVGPLIGFLKDAEWEGRFHIAPTLARFPSEATRDALLRLLGDPHKMVRQAALDGVVSLGMPVPSGPVCALLRDPDLVVQAKAIETAIKLNDPGSVRYLLEILQDESEHVRRGAVEVLNAVGDANAIKDLLLALKDKDWWVRVRAADALGAIGGPKVIDAVLHLLGEEDEFLRRTAVEILNTTKDERAFEYLVKALGDADWWVRERAVDALASLGDKRAVPHLVGLLAEDTPATPAAIRALAQIADPAAVEPILAKLASADDVIQREAIDALGTLAAPQQMEAVLKGLRELDARSTEARDLAQRIASELAAKSPQRGPRRTAAAPDRVPAAHAETMYARPPSKEPAAAQGGKESPAPAAAAGAPVRVNDEVIEFGTIQPGLLVGGRYRVVKELGRGGFGTVFKVEDKMVQEEIALKFINPQLVQDENIIARFIHEVRYARKITHQNVIRIHDFLTFGRLHAISMEYFASHPLARRILRGLHQNQALGLKFVRAIARGVYVAHQADIVHRDLKPANILVNDEDVLKIVDFGLAAACSHADSRLTKTGHMIGTPAYMSPEHARGGNIDIRTDIYSLGVIMYEIFTGTVPYSGDHAVAVVFQHLEGKKEPPRSRNPAIEPQLEAIILKAMALDPDDRYQNLKDLLADLDPLGVTDAE